VQEYLAHSAARSRLEVEHAGFVGIGMVQALTQDLQTETTVALQPCCQRGRFAQPVAQGRRHEQDGKAIPPAEFFGH
jgi:hypothetical protein